jgi:beta-lactamase class A
MSSRSVLVAILVVVLLRPMPSDAAVRGSELVADLSRAAAARSGSVSVTVYDELTHRSYSYRPSAAYDSASIVKVNILETLMWQRQQRGVGLTATQERLARLMITRSDNDAASALWATVGRASGVRAYDRLIGLTSTTFDPGGAWGLTRTTSPDQVRLLRAVTFGPGPLSSRARLFIRGLMLSVVTSQKWGVSAGVPSGPYVELKNGWLPRATGGWRVHSIGHVRVQGRNYDIAVLSMNNPSMAYGVSTIEALSRIVYRDLG